METGTLTQLNVQPGDVVECVRWYDGDDYDEVNPHTIDDRGYAVDARGWCFQPDDKSTFRIVSRATPAVDLTAITTPFGLLDKTTQDALKAHGGPYESFGSYGWHEADPQFSRAFTVRVKPAPKRETVTRDMWADAETGLTYRDERPGTTPIRITVEKVDGKADWSTHRVEARK